MTFAFFCIFCIFWLFFAYRAFFRFFSAFFDVSGRYFRFLGHFLMFQALFCILGHFLKFWALFCILGLFLGFLSTSNVLFFYQWHAWSFLFKQWHSSQKGWPLLVYNNKLQYRKSYRPGRMVPPIRKGDHHASILFLQTCYCLSVCLCLSLSLSFTFIFSEVRQY